MYVCYEFVVHEPHVFDVRDNAKRIVRRTRGHEKKLLLAVNGCGAQQ
jgi:hypothetical protein